MSSDPLARDVPAHMRQATLERLLAIVEAKRKGPKPAPPRTQPAVSPAAPALSLVPKPRAGDRRARLEALLERVRRAPRRTHR